MESGQPLADRGPYDYSILDKTGELVTPESISALVDAFAGITPEERHAIAVSSCARRDAWASASPSDPYSNAWAEVYAIIGAAAYEATARERRSEYEARLRASEERNRRHGLDVRGHELSPA